MINILMIDDNTAYIYYFRELLKESSLKFNLVEASNPLEGLEKFNKFLYLFDYIICDYYLPIQNGQDFLEIVKSHNVNILCLLISADDSLRPKSLRFIDNFFGKTNSEKIVEYLENNYHLKIS